MNKNYNMKEYSKFPIVKPVEWKGLLNTKDEMLIDLVIKILQYSPKRRYTPAEAIMHQYFNELRNESGYKELLLKCKNIPELFHFSKGSYWV
jgi:serine/threonine protein kinase